MPKQAQAVLEQGQTEYKEKYHITHGSDNYKLDILLRDWFQKLRL